MSSDRWQSAIDEAIQKAIKDGQIDDLPGAGKPLNLLNNPNTPDDMKMAYKIMADNNVAPEWVMMGKTLEKSEQNLRSKLQAGVRAYRAGIAAADRAGSSKAAYLENAQRAWDAAQRTLKVLAEQHNNQIATYNLKVPPAIPQRRLFQLEQEIQQALNG